MQNKKFVVEKPKPFSESLIWQLNRNFYHEKGIDAWSEDLVPHHLTSNSKVGKLYAALIHAALKDLAKKGQVNKTVYILELGAGHGRLAFHILKHLLKLTGKEKGQLPPFCYVLTDIVENNLSFFSEHPQFKLFFEQGILDLAYFDALETKAVFLQKSKRWIREKELDQPLIAIGNYFFDSLPCELFHIENSTLSSCLVSLQSSIDPQLLDATAMIKNIQASFHLKDLAEPYLKDPVKNEILKEYQRKLVNSYLFFPEKSMQCLENVKALSQKGMILLTMDKGYHEIHNLENQPAPDMVTHGSFSIWVNYHALNAYCQKTGGEVLLPLYSNFHLEVECLLFMKDAHSYDHVRSTYRHYVNDFGPDDFNSLKHMAYNHSSIFSIQELLALYRLSDYDASFFIKFLPQLKGLAKNITFNERRRLAQSMHKVWEQYFSINEAFDLPYDLGGIFYDLGFYVEALEYFNYSVTAYGFKADTYFNLALCLYQLRQDELFEKTVLEARKAFPEYKNFDHLDSLDMS